MVKLRSPIRRIRDERDWSIKECADRLDIRPGSVGKIELGLMRIPVQCLAKLEELGYHPVAIVWEQEEFMQKLRKLGRSRVEDESNTQAHRHQRIG